VPERAAQCPACGQMREVRSLQSVDGSEDFLNRKLVEMGVPPFDYFIGRMGLEQIAFELSADAAQVLGPLHQEGGLA
jgi:hypothetical protein